MTAKTSSRMSSMKPEDIAWREEQAFISGQIEGIERDPDLAQFVQQMKDEGLSPERRIARLVDLACSLGEQKEDSHHEQLPHSRHL